MRCPLLRNLTVVQTVAAANADEAKDCGPFIAEVTALGHPSLAEVSFEGFAGYSFSIRKKKIDGEYVHISRR